MIHSHTPGERRFADHHGRMSVLVLGRQLGEAVYDGSIAVLLGDVRNKAENELALLHSVENTRSLEEFAFGRILWVFD